MITYPSKIYTEAEMLELWNSQWGESREENWQKIYSQNKNPRKTRPTLSPYSVDNVKYLIAFDGDIIVGYSGWSEKNSYVVLAGSTIATPYRGERISSNLIDKRMQLIKDKPILVSINNKTIPDSGWMSAFERRGWIKNPTDEEVPQGLPMEAVESERKRIGGDKILVWNPNSMNKAWNILKSLTESEAISFMLMEN